VAVDVRWRSPGADRNPRAPERFVEVHLWRVPKLDAGVLYRSKRVSHFARSRESARRRRQLNADQLLIRCHTSLMVTLPTATDIEHLPGTRTVGAWQARRLACTTFVTKVKSRV